MNSKSKKRFLLLTVVLFAVFVAVYYAGDIFPSQTPNKSNEEINPTPSLSLASSIIVSTDPVPLVTPKYLAAVLIIEKRKWGFINKKGEIVIEAKYDRALSFSEGLAAVKVGEEWGFIDSEGKMVIEPRFKSVVINDGYQFFGGFSKGLAAVSTAEGSMYINKKGANAFGKIFDSVTCFYDDIATVKYKGKYAFMNAEGTLTHVFEDDKIEWVEEMSDALAGVKIDGLVGFFDKEGVMKIEPQFEFVWSFNEGLCLVMDEGDNPHIINKQGDIVISGIVSVYEYFYNGTILVQFDENDDEEIVCIDKLGRRIGESTYQTSYPFRCGLKVEKSEDPSKFGFGYIDDVSDWVIEPQYFYAYPFVNVFNRNVN